MSGTVHAEVNYCPTCGSEVTMEAAGYHCSDCDDIKAITATVLTEGSR